MNVWIDADACPVVDIAVRLCAKYHIPCTLLCDTAHSCYREGANTLIFDKGADSVDFALVNRVRPVDVVITQDYGLASMCLGRNARVLHQDGWEYTADNISGLMEQRHAAKKYRMAGGRTKGPSKRTKQQDQAFENAFQQLLQGYACGGSKINSMGSPE